MNVYYVTFRSVTPAQMGERALQRAGIRCGLQRTPRWMEEKGCGYCLRLREEEIREAVGILRKNRVPFRKVYRMDETGGFEEAVL